MLGWDLLENMAYVASDGNVNRRINEIVTHRSDNAIAERSQRITRRLAIPVVRKPIEQMRHQFTIAGTADAEHCFAYHGRCRIVHQRDEMGFELWLFQRSESLRHLTSCELAHFTLKRQHSPNSVFPYQTSVRCAAIFCDASQRGRLNPRVLVVQVVFQSCWLIFLRMLTQVRHCVTAYIRIPIFEQAFHLTRKGAVAGCTQHFDGACPNAV